MEFRDRLRQLRQETELNQTEFGQKFNVIKQTVSSWENGNSKPDLDLLIAIADFFNVSTDFLLGRSGMLQRGKNLSPEKERLINEIQQASDDDLKEMEYILKYLKSKKEKNEDAATIA